MPGVPKPRSLPKPRRPLKKSGRIKPKKRTAGEFRRIYGSKARVEWCHRQPCVACHGVGNSEMAHTGTGGVGRKADASKTIPLCGRRGITDGYREFNPEGCHRTLHRIGRRLFEQVWGIDLDECAAEVERRWQAFSKEGE